MVSDSKHNERDRHLPEQRNQLREIIETDLINDESILSIFYGGSIGNKNTDWYSDIDLRIVVEADKLAEYISKKNSRAQKWGNVLFFENLNRSSNYTIAHYDCFIKVDVFYYTFEMIQPSIWLKNIQIIKDTDEAMTAVLMQSNRLSYELSFDEFNVWRTKYFAYLHEAYRRSKREEYYYALACLDKLRLLMVMGWYMMKGIHPNTLGDWAKYEGERSQLEHWQRELLDDWQCGRNDVEIMKTLGSISTEFIKIHRTLCNQLTIDENLKWIENIVSKVL